MEEQHNFPNFYSSSRIFVPEPLTNSQFLCINHAFYYFLGFQKNCFSFSTNVVRIEITVTVRCKTTNITSVNQLFGIRLFVIVSAYNISPNYICLKAINFIKINIKRSIQNVYIFITIALVFNPE